MSSQMAEVAEAPVGSAGLADPIATCRAALAPCQDLLTKMRTVVADRVVHEGSVDAARLDGHQTLVHGFAWYATYVEGLTEMIGWADRLTEYGHFGELEGLILQAAFGEYLGQLAGGVALSQVEIVRPQDFGLATSDIAAFLAPPVDALVRGGNTDAVRRRIVELISHAPDAGIFGAGGLEDESLEMVRDQIQRFVKDRVIDVAHEWHLKDELIPLDVVEQMAELGVFGLTVPEAWDGLGMGKTAMCVVTEELSRGYIGVGSLGTRSEIAAELIQLGGTDAQKAHYLPKIAMGEILPTAVFTEPNIGSDLANLRTRAVRDGDTYRITGSKTWITHAARSDLMTLLARTDPDQPGYRGLSMFLIDKPRGSDEEPFSLHGMTGGEIAVLGYRGMKEYEIGFDNVVIPASSLLGDREGQGFRQLMATFEAARIQTAARAVGVAQNALEIGLRYAVERIQFDRPIIEFPRVYAKLAWMAVEIMIARQLTYFSARAKDEDVRCDIEAGMAKLLAARVAFAAADAALQIHGGNGYSVEYPISRVLCDARVLSIFEGAAEIQAQVIARGLLSRRTA